MVNLTEPNGTATRDFGVGDRDALPGELCSCGRQAAVMFEHSPDEDGPVGWCGLEGGGDFAPRHHAETVRAAATTSATPDSDLLHRWLGSTVRGYRRWLGVARDELADAATMTAERLQAVEDGAGVTVEELHRIAKGLGRDARELTPWGPPETCRPI